jgi:hypothetical protein
MTSYHMTSYEEESCHASPSIFPILWILLPNVFHINKDPFKLLELALMIQLNKLQLRIPFPNQFMFAIHMIPIILYIFLGKHGPPPSLHLCRFPFPQRNGLSWYCVVTEYIAYNTSCASWTDARSNSSLEYSAGDDSDSCGMRCCYCCCWAASFFNCSNIGLIMASSSCMVRVT